MHRRSLVGIVLNALDCRCFSQIAFTSSLNLVEYLYKKPRVKVDAFFFSDIMCPISPTANNTIVMFMSGMFPSLSV